MTSPNFSKTQLKIIDECVKFVWNLADKGFKTNKDFSPEINDEFISILMDTADFSGIKSPFDFGGDDEQVEQYREAYDKMMKSIEENLFDDDAFEGSNVTFPHDWILNEQEVEEAYN